MASRTITFVFALQVGYGTMLPKTTQISPLGAHVKSKVSQGVTVSIHWVVQCASHVLCAAHAHNSRPYLSWFRPYVLFFSRGGPLGAMAHMTVSALEQACGACTTLVQCTLWLFLANCGVWGAPWHPARAPIVRAMCVPQLSWRAYD